MLEIKYKLLENGVAPEFKRQGDVCLDCHSAITTEVRSGERELIPLGFALELPELYEAVIRPRSGLSSKGIDVAIGTVDTNYRGEVKACVINNSEETFRINFGDRICQLAIRSIPEIKMAQVEELTETIRGDKGFGSSGV